MITVRPAPAAAAPPADGRVILASSAPALRVIAYVGEAPPTRSEGYGGFEEIQRPRRTAFLEWRGRSLPRLALDLVLDGWATGASQEGFIRNLERWAQPAPETGNQPPPIFVGGPVPTDPTVPWVIDALEWGDDVLRREDGQRVRQGFTLTLLEFVQPDLALRRSAAPKAATRTYVVKAGEHLGEIAARQLGKASRWREIARLNGIRDPKSVKAGQRIKLPAS